MPKSRGGTFDEKGQWHATENRLVLPFWEATIRCGRSSATIVDNEESRKALTSRAATFSGTPACETLGAGKSEARAARHTERAVICEKQMDIKTMLERKPCPFLAQIHELCVRFHAFFPRFTCVGARLSAHSPLRVFLSRNSTRSTSAVAAKRRSAEWRKRP